MLTDEQRRELEAAGVVVGTTADFLGLSEDEEREVERRVYDYIERYKPQRSPDPPTMWEWVKRRWVKITH